MLFIALVLSALHIAEPSNVTGATGPDKKPVRVDLFLEYVDELNYTDGAFRTAAFARWYASLGQCDSAQFTIRPFFNHTKRSDTQDSCNSFTYAQLVSADIGKIDLSKFVKSNLGKFKRAADASPIRTGHKIQRNKNNVACMASAGDLLENSNGVKFVENEEDNRNLALFIYGNPQSPDSPVLNHLHQKSTTFWHVSFAHMYKKIFSQYVIWGTMFEVRASDNRSSGILMDFSGIASDKGGTGDRIKDTRIKELEAQVAKLEKETPFFEDSTKLILVIALAVVTVGFLLSLFAVIFCRKNKQPPPTPPTIRSGSMSKKSRMSSRSPGRSKTVSRSRSSSATTRGMTGPTTSRSRTTSRAGKTMTTLRTPTQRSRSIQRPTTMRSTMKSSRR